jgi:hypothetical protein
MVSAYGADPSGKESAGKSYVIFGKTDNTAINLSAIGTGGFVINGENAGGRFCRRQYKIYLRLFCHLGLQRRRCQRRWLR